MSIKNTPSLLLNEQRSSVVGVGGEINMMAAEMRLQIIYRARLITKHFIKWIVVKTSAFFNTVVHPY